MEEDKKLNWKIPWRGVGVAFGSGLLALYLVFRKVAPPGEILDELRVYPLSYFFVALGFVLAAWIVDGQRIGMLVRAMGRRISWWQLAVVLGAANFLSLVTPFAGGGGVLVVYFLYRSGFSAPAATAVVLAGGMAGQLSLALLSVVLFTLVRNVPTDLAQVFLYVRIFGTVYIGAVIGLMFLIVKSDRFFEWVFKKRSKKSRSAQWLTEFRRAYTVLVTRRRAHLAACIFVALSYYGIYYLGGFTLLSGFSVYHPVLRYAVSVMFGLAPVFSPIPGGAGLSEGMAYLVLDALPDDALATFIVLWRTVVFYIPILLGGGIFAMLAFRWALRSPGTSPDSVILSETEDHNR
ncbi:MAG: lysylphosphatidylglycerol synthase transmembrane domain-containing protein [Limnochordia bacterium]|jgi:uncharacterized protein (TIRG00374 family)